MYCTGCPTKHDSWWIVFHNLLSCLIPKRIIKITYMVVISIYLFIYINNCQNGWTDRALTWPQGKFIDDKIFKNLRTKNSTFMKFANPRTFFWFGFTLFTKRKCSQLKYKMGAKHPKSLVKVTIDFKLYYIFE